jgi:hypothetical protein
MVRACILLCVLLAACSSEPRPPVVVLGVDGGSWDLVFRYTREGRLPHLASLVARGSGGYVNSILWRRFEVRRRGYFSPIIWSSIATGKRPDQHGVEDFLLPSPRERDFFLLGGIEPGRLDLPLLHPGSLLIEGAAVAGESLSVQVRLQGRPLGRIEFPAAGAVLQMPLPAESLPAGPVRIELQADPPGPAVPALRVRRLGLLDAAGHLVRWLHPRQNEAELRGAWHWTPPGRGVPAASYHLLARPVWDIASEAGRRVAVVGWWATWPATPVHGALISDAVGRKARSSAGLVEPPDLWPLVQRTVEQALPLQERWKADYADVLGCGCLGPVQRRVYLDHRWEDELRLRLAEKLAAEGPDLLLLYLRLVDATSHQFLGYERPAERERCREPGCNAERLGEMVPHSYELLDEAVGRLQRALPADAVWLLVSDHGQLSLEGKPGLHQNNGFVLLAGPGVRPGLLFEAQVTDVAPTLLYLLDLPVPADMSGRVLAQAFEPDRLRLRPPAYGPSYEDLLAPLPQGEAVVDEQMAEDQLEVLRALGYVR